MSQEKESFRLISDAILTENVEDIKTILTKINTGKVVLFDRSTRTSVLHVASKTDNISVWKALLSCSAVLRVCNKQDQMGVTPLLSCIIENNISAVALLLAVDHNLINAVSKSQKTCLHFAATLPTVDLIEVLLEFDQVKKYINSEDIDGCTPLMISVVERSPTYMKLIEFGADHLLQNRKTKRNILHYAVTKYYENIFQDIIRRIRDKRFYNTVDVNGDTAFMIAVRLGEQEAIKTLLTLPVLSNKSKINRISNETCLHITVRNNKPDLLKLILQIDVMRDRYINIPNKMGLTPLLYSVELKIEKCIHILLYYGSNITLFSETTGNSILHLAVETKSCKILKSLLEIEEIYKIVKLRNFVGKTAFEMALCFGNIDTLIVFLESGLVSCSYTNKNDETTIFIAAKCGNYDVLQYLLLSDRYLLFLTENKERCKEELEKAEVRGDIYCSDLFILTGETMTERGWAKNPEQDHLFKSNKLNQNIFHACALGGNIDCTQFVFEYCDRYYHTNEIDSQDANKETPLYIAASHGYYDVSKFFIMHNAQLCKKNKGGISALNALKNGVANYNELITEVLNESIEIGCIPCGNKLLPHHVKVNFGVLCPKGRNQCDLTLTLFKEISDEKVLKHPLITYFTHRKYESIHFVHILQFLNVFIMTVLFSFYTSVSLCPLVAAPKIFLSKFKAFLKALSIFNCFFLVSNLYTTSNISIVRRCLSIVTYGTPYLTLSFLALKNCDCDIGHKIGAFTVLAHWFSLLYHMCLAGINNHIFVFFRVTESMIHYLLVPIVVFIAFSFSFFLLYSKYYNYNNPLHSLIYTVSVLANGELYELPFLYDIKKKNETDFFFGHKHDLLTCTHELKDISTEGVLILLFQFLVMMSLLNMLSGLGVKGYSQLIREGNLSELKCTAASSWETENFCNSKLYKLFSHFKATWLIGFPGDLKKKLFLPLTEQPTKERKQNPFIKSHLLSLFANGKSNAEKTHPIKTFSYQFKTELQIKFNKV